ncbi:predicted protein [Chaetomium globosum CBS 148.51]|uniref:Uncharacterized protein n=1 Tax=Chaetomium globosum (strain ATCC 6205 / CBS 148.51 / DSM 1962 / NBRC 6347 / NRRL 1970) TaxID=306901 RepID=Q2H5R2_CHAGB|nr:uncharacterized protein CHGG_06003 [Chaetomium globosum CBS 148.51]EAQ89384.1 predicted protein [Chaetomium globosum CBS 148.51]
MLYNILILALTLVTFVFAHGKVTVVTGDAGGNGTALGILGGIIPAAAPNLRVRLPAPSPYQPHKPPAYPTSIPPTNDNNDATASESDTTIFPDRALLSDGLGRTAASGPNTIAMIVHAMRLSGTVLPQLTPGGNLSGTFFVVTTAGAGPLHAVLDPSATGRFSEGVRLEVVRQIPGGGGGGGGEDDDDQEAETAAGADTGEFVSSRKPALLLPSKVSRRRSSAWARLVDTVLGTELGRAVRLWRRGVPERVNQGFEFVFAVPENLTCTGVVASMTGVCLVKIANANETGPFGGVVPVQMAVPGGWGGGNGTFLGLDGRNGTANSTAAIAALCGRAFKE